MHLSIVGGYKNALPSGTWSIATIEVALRDRKFTCSRPHIFNSLTWHLLALSDFGYVLSVGESCFEGMFCSSDRGSGGRGEGVSIQGSCLGWL